MMPHAAIDVMMAAAARTTKKTTTRRMGEEGSRWGWGGHRRRQTGQQKWAQQAARTVGDSRGGFWSLRNQAWGSETDADFGLDGGSITPPPPLPGISIDGDRHSKIVFF